MCVDLSKIGCDDIAVRPFQNHGTGEHDDGGLDHDIELDAAPALLQLVGLVGGSLACRVVDGLHLAEFDEEVDDLAERLLDEVHLDRPGPQMDGRVVARVAVELRGIEGLVTEVGQLVALDRDKPAKTRVLRDAEVNVVHQTQVSKPCRNAHGLAEQENADVGMIEG